MGNRITRTVLFAASALFSVSAFGAGAARFGTLRNADWVVTNAWQAVSNKTHDLIIDMGQEASLPPDWLNVSNAAMSAVQSLQPATNYTDRALGEFAATGTVRSAEHSDSAERATFADYWNGLPDWWSSEEPSLRSGMTNAAIAVADARISTNNAAFVAAVLAAPLAGADADDLSEIAEYGSYGTVGAALLALIAGLAALKRRMAAAETEIGEKADAADLRYALAAPGWSLPLGPFPFAAPSGFPSATVDGEAITGGIYIESVKETESVNGGICVARTDSHDLAQFGEDGSLVYVYDGVAFVSTPSLASSILLDDRAANAVRLSADATLTLPAAIEGHVRDLIVRLTVTATSAATWSVAQGETWDAAGAPPGSFAAGTYLYRFTEVAPGVWHCEDMLALVGLEAALADKMPQYPMVAVAPSSGTLTVTPYTVATYTAGTTAAAFTVAVGAGMTGRTRDCELVIDCTATGAVAPTVTWPSNFHPRTDAGTDFACKAGVRNVYYVSEYATGQFAVGGWQETTGGNA